MDYQQQLIKHMLASSQDRSVVSAQSAINVYKNNYLETGINALSISFPSVHAFMDEQDFRKLSISFLKAHPKHCFDWADYGESFAEYMYDIDELAAFPFLPELAELDWRCMQVERSKDKIYDAESFSLMQSHELENLRFRAAPGLQVMQAVFPIIELREASKNPSISMQSVNKLVIDAINSPVYRSIVLWREQFKSEALYCEANSILAFENMINQLSIADVLAVFKDDESAMTNWLQTQIQGKIIFAVELVA